MPKKQLSPEEKIELLEERLKILEEKASFGKEKKPKKPRKPTAFNIFMKDAIAKVKKENPTITHNDAFKMATTMWSEQKNN